MVVEGGGGGAASFSFFQRKEKRRDGDGAAPWSGGGGGGGGAGGAGGAGGEESVCLSGLPTFGAVRFPVQIHGWFAEATLGRSDGRRARGALCVLLRRASSTPRLCGFVVAAVYCLVASSTASPLSS